ncbi:flagellar biosynthetic protein FliR [Thermovenabulum sp.]|uniref:flagellar biosynthetic protein FliR n=1 Tax=Thermovenabulum sp. TaxID=3100335 RepID=UPI003C7D81D5
MNNFSIALQDFLKFLYILMRIISFMTVAPVFGRRETPLQIKIGFSMLLAIIIFPFIENQGFNYDIIEFIYYTLKEIFTGLIMGFCVFTIFSLFYITGQMIDLQMGFGIVNVIDPQSNTQIPLMGNFYYILATLIFLTVNGHHVLIAALIKSYDFVPMGRGSFASYNLLNVILNSFKYMVITGIKMSLPVITMILIVDFILAIIAKIAPQINVFIVGLPLKILIGVFAIIIVIPSFIIALDGIFNGIYDGLFSVLRGMMTSE